MKPENNTAHIKETAMLHLDNFIVRTVMFLLQRSFFQNIAQECIEHVVYQKTRNN